MCSSSFRRSATIAALLLLVAGALASAAPDAEMGEPAVRIDSEVAEQYYDVRGRTADEVFASIQRKRLGSEAGLTASGLTRARISYDVASEDDESGCRLVDVALHVRIVVTLPRHADRLTLDADTRRAWDAYAAQVEFHEFRHVEIELGGVEEVKKKLTRAGLLASQGCIPYAERVIREQERVTARRNERFHEEESAEIRRAQARLRGQIDSVDAALGQEKQRIDALAEDLDELRRAQSERTLVLDELVERLRLAPNPEEIARTQSLREELALLTEEAGAAIALHNSLAESYNERMDERERLVSDLEWTR